MSDDLLDETRRSWTLATQAHNRLPRILGVVATRG